MSMSDESMSVEADLPDNYRDSAGEENCGNCAIASHEDDGLHCEKFDTEVESQKVCNSWTDEKIEQAEAIPQEPMTPVERPAAHHVTMDLHIDKATALV